MFSNYDIKQFESSIQNFSLLVVKPATELTQRQRSG